MLTVLNFLYLANLNSKRRAIKSCIYITTKYLGLPRLVQDQYHGYEKRQPARGTLLKILQQDIWAYLVIVDILT